jgi:peptidoglycan/LPS O-acetylase OafA/YrhL
MFLAELNADFGPDATSVMPRAVSALMVVFGLFLSSIPEENADWMPWSRVIVWTASMIVPAGGEINRYVVSVGTTMVMYGVFFSPDARRILAHPVMNFLGRISFPVYLLHNTLIRTVLSWMVYRHDFMMQGLHPVDENGNPRWLARGGFVSFWTSILAFYACLIYSAHLWTIHVDPHCEKVVTWMSNRMLGNHEEHTATKEGVLVGTVLAKWQ